MVCDLHTRWPAPASRAFLTADHGSGRGGASARLEFLLHVRWPAPVSGSLLRADHCLCGLQHVLGFFLTALSTRVHSRLSGLFVV